MKPSSDNNGLSPGEARIRRALLWSAGAAGLLAAALVGVYAFLHRTPSPADRTAAVEASPVAPGPEPTSPETPPKAYFTDITRQAGLRFRHTNGAYGEHLMPETIGSGVAFVDYDQDGDPDLLLVDSSYWAGHEGAASPHQTLYRNDGTGHFEEVSTEAGLGQDFFGMGVAVGDYDNDGWPDLFITAVGHDHLYHNRQGHFEEVSASAGVAGGPADWSTCAAFIDYDNDGDLDLFVCQYVKWSRDTDLRIDFKLTGLGRAYGAPNHFVGTHSRLYRNDGDGRFTDVSAETGIQITDPHSGRPEGKALGVAPVDYDRDGWIDLFIANDTERNFLFHNLGNGHFEEVGAFEGIAFDRNGKATSGMGIDAAWYRNDDDLAVAIGNFANEMTSFFTTSDGAPPFADEAMLEGIGAPSRLALTFAVLFFDYDLDGRLDLFQANGHLEPDINKVQPGQHYAQPLQLFRNCAPACEAAYRLVEGNPVLDRPLVGRGAAYADIDGDGDLDLAITQNGRPAVLLRNDLTPPHWLRVDVEGTRANRDGIGAVIELRTASTLQRRRVMPTRGFLSQSEKTVTFGLDDARIVNALRVIWPGGTVQQVEVPKVDTILHIKQPVTAEAGP